MGLTDEAESCLYAGSFSCKLPYTDAMRSTASITPGILACVSVAQRQRGQLCRRLLQSEPLVHPSLEAMEDALAASLRSLTAKGNSLGARPSPEQLGELRSACTAALAVAKSQGLPGAVHHKRLWEAAASLWVGLRV